MVNLYFDEMCGTHFIFLSFCWNKQSTKYATWFYDENLCNPHTHILEILNISNNNKKALEKYGIWYKVPAALCIIIIIIKNASSTSSQANCERDPGRCTAGIFTHTHGNNHFFQHFIVSATLLPIVLVQNGRSSARLHIFYSETLCSRRCH